MLASKDVLLYVRKMSNICLGKQPHSLNSFLDGKNSFQWEKLLSVQKKYTIRAENESFGSATDAVTAFG